MERDVFFWVVEFVDTVPCPVFVMISNDTLIVERFGY